MQSVPIDTEKKQWQKNIPNGYKVYLIRGFQSMFWETLGFCKAEKGEGKVGPQDANFKKVLTLPVSALHFHEPKSECLLKFCILGSLLASP